MDTLQEYIFGTLNFRPCRSFRVLINCLCIDYVLQTKYGQDIIVVTIYHSVARRLGLRCDVVFVKTETCIFWKPKFVTNNLDNARCFHIKDENFPMCFNNFPEHYTVIRTKEMLSLLRDFYGMFITRHELTTMTLVKVHCDVLITYPH
ncbi:uncharacterized protein LOC114936535 [Nylanderia fulva]|uniref:uncharacterized protein LOC114936535 n=1 Tax=Nylanderia fulva TaxID=613905 RepID=UPI0010FB2AA9|nr:uncharacterized protein LOC114936535 [Nylanderia fulva]